MLLKARQASAELKAHVGVLRMSVCCSTPISGVRTLFVSPKEVEEEWPWIDRADTWSEAGMPSLAYPAGSRDPMKRAQ